MTDVLDPPVATRHAVLGFAEGLEAALDRVAGTPAWSMSVAEQRETLVSLARVEARLAELRLRVLVAADRNEVGADSGATSTASWLSRVTGATRVSVAADLRLAVALDDGFEATRRALAAGVVDVDRAGVVVAAVQRLTAEHEDMPVGSHRAAEAHLLGLASRFDAVVLRRLGKRVFEVVCPQAAEAEEGRLLAVEESRARRSAWLSMRDLGDGTVEGRFRLPVLHAAVLKKAIEALTAPRRLGAGRIEAVTGKKLPYPTLLGQGFMELIEHHLGVGSLPSQAGSPFTLVVTIDLAALRAGLGAAGVETGDRISAREARRLACAAAIIPMVLDGDSMPVDLGREQRIFSRYQKTALTHLFGGCATAGCDMPASWLEFHHRDPWSHGGATDLVNGLPLCPPHHHKADHPDTWTMTHNPDSTINFHRRT